MFSQTKNNSSSSLNTLELVDDFESKTTASRDGGSADPSIIGGPGVCSDEVDSFRSLNSRTNHIHDDTNCNGNNIQSFNSSMSHLNHHNRVAFYEIQKTASTDSTNSKTSTPRAIKGSGPSNFHSSMSLSQKANINLSIKCPDPALAMTGVGAFLQPSQLQSGSNNTSAFGNKVRRTSNDFGASPQSFNSSNRSSQSSQIGANSRCSSVVGPNFFLDANNRSASTDSMDDHHAPVNVVTLEKSLRKAVFSAKTAELSARVNPNSSSPFNVDPSKQAIVSAKDNQQKLEGNGSSSSILSKTSSSLDHYGGPHKNRTFASFGIGAAQFLSSKQGGKQLSLASLLSSSSSFRSIQNNRSSCDIFHYFQIFQIFYNNREVTQEYSDFSINQRSFFIVLACAAFFTISFGFAVVAPFTLPTNQDHYAIIFLLSTISWIMNLINTVLCWLLVYRQTNHFSDHYERQGVFQNWIYRHSSNIQYYLLISLSLGYSFRLNARVLGGDCTHNTEMYGSLSEWNCNPLASVQELPIDTLFAMFFTPIAYPAVFRESRADVILICSCILGIAMLMAMMIMGSIESLYIIGIHILCSVIAIDSARQSMNAFISHKQLKEALVQNQQVSAQSEVEMRHVLGNVAHDFKTVSTLFLSGFRSVLTFSYLNTASLFIHEWY